MAKLTSLTLSFSYLHRYNHLKRILVALAIVFSSFIANAQYGFETSFDQANGQVVINGFSFESVKSGGFLLSRKFVNRATVSYSTDGTNFTNFYEYGFDEGNIIKDPSQIINSASSGYDVATNLFDLNNSSTNPQKGITIRLSIKNPYQNIKKIRITYVATENSYVTPITSAGRNETATADITIPQLSSITATYEFRPVLVNNVYAPKAVLSYTKPSLNSLDEKSSMNLYDVPLTTSYVVDAVTKDQGSYNVDIASSQKDYYFRQDLYGGRVYNTSSTLTVPAFTFPKTASATYNAADQKVIFTWTMDAVSSSNVIGDDFKIQIADNPSFNSPLDRTVKYDPAKTSFSYEVDKNLSTNMYFRVSRVGTNFGWEVYKQASVPVPYDAIPSATAVLSGKAALITWEPKASAFIPGATFVITRTNNTSKTQTEIKLTKADFDKGTYTDNLVTNCNSYSYSLQVVPPVGSAFSAQPAVKAAGEVIPVDIGTISNLTASKGYFPDRTELRWTANGGFDNFIVQRAPYGSNNFVQVAQVSGSSSSEYQTDDAKGAPGVYYTYRIWGVVKCNGENKSSADTLTSIGFRSPTGNIYGRVTYESGQAVEDVAVRLQSSDVAQLGRSVYLNGTVNSFLKLDSTTMPFSDTGFTVEAWIKPDDATPTGQTLFLRTNQYTLSFNSLGKLSFSYKGTRVTGNYSNPGNSYVHVAGIRTPDSLFLMLNDTIVGRAAAASGTAVPYKELYIGQNFKGYIDEMRVFNRALTPAEIAKNQTRIFAGNEDGLVAYWRFDETITNQFYDLSYKGDSYNRNDGTMDPATVTRSSVVPTLDQLSYKSFTDNSGNYFIAGIPYIGNGTTYTVAPLKGTHQFDPISVNRLISPASSQFTVDFKDKSSFPVSGFVYYRNTTVPVPGVLFRVDGQYAQKSNGELIQTNGDGSFTISVPVGIHEVRAEKADHVFVNGGKITDLNGNNLNYQGNISNVQLVDSTTIRFIGRVAGGAVQADLPLGLSVSKNNLGVGTKISLKLPTTSGTRLFDDGKDINDQTKVTSSTVTVSHLLPANKAGGTPAKTKVTYGESQIDIEPDPSTGEFVADLIPIKFITDNVTVKGWGNLVAGQAVTLDFTNKFVKQSSVRRYTDSTYDSQTNSYIKTAYYDSITYNDSYKFIKRVQPTVQVYQQSQNGQPQTYFGNLTYEALSLAGTKDTIRVVDTLTQPGVPIYKFGYPLFIQDQQYTFGVAAFENYNFYEADGTVNATKSDRVPTTDGLVTFLNAIMYDAVAADTFRLDNKGLGTYQFRAGSPNLTTALKDLSVSVQFGGATNVVWKWKNNQGELKDQLQGIVAGLKMQGTDFVTAGPDRLLMVLRDPPGSRSYSFAEQGSTLINSVAYSGSVNQVGTIDLAQKTGLKFTVFAGLGAGTISSAETSITNKFTIKHEENFTRTNTKVETNTLTSRFQTGDDASFTGPDADVYVGHSTNITYGASSNVTLVKNTETTNEDKILFTPPNSDYSVVVRDGIGIGQTFGTLFAYTQKHIENTLIPNLIKIRNLALLPKGSISPQAAQAKANNDKVPVYVSNLESNDPKFGKSNRDTLAFGAAAKTDDYSQGPSYTIYFPTTPKYRTDTIMTLNQYIDAWKARMADNEKAKLESELIQNYSFQAGSPISYSKSTSIATTKKNSFSIILAGVFNQTASIKVNDVGLDYVLEESLATTQGGTFSSSSDSTSTLGFSLGSNGSDDYFSVDVKKAKDNTFVFQTKGGVSACPYMGATATKYYKPSTPFDQPTQRIEVPKMSVDKPVATNVPTTRKAVYTLTLRNESEAKLDGSYLIRYADVKDVAGATLAIDGSPISSTGRLVSVPYGQTVTKVLTLTKGPDSLNYRNLPVILSSGCQLDIADTVLLSAFFIPSCSDVNIKSPGDKWVLNTESPMITSGADSGKRYLPITIDQYDVNNTLFDHIELQYKPASSSTWVTTMKFYWKQALFAAAQGPKQLFTNAAAINYNFILDDAAFSDQAYNVRAVGYCSVGAAYVTTESNTVNGIKDTYNPRLFGSPQPANGILTAADDIRLNFNETIAAGLLTPADFQVTGIRNGAKTDHSVSVRLDGASSYLATEFEKSFAGKSITAELWVQPFAAANGTVFSHGGATESMEMALTSDKKLQVTVGSQVIASAPLAGYQAGQWMHLALVYNDVRKTVSAFANFTEVISAASVNAYNGIGRIEYGRSIKTATNYFKGNIHDARIWNDTLSGLKLQVNSLKVLSGIENNLLSYYPMDEGKGTAVLDKAYGANAVLTGQWSTPAGKALSLNATGYLKINTAFAPVTSTMDYTMELWFKGDGTQANATLASSGKGDGTDPDGSLNLFSLGFEGGLLTYRNNGFRVQADGNYLDNQWHHVAVAVNRNGGSAQLSVDGKLNQFWNADNIGGLAAANTYLGARAYFTTANNLTPTIDRNFAGNLDEFRIWNTFLSPALLAKKNNVHLQGTELGLLAYYPFETYISNQGTPGLYFSLNDAKVQEVSTVQVPEASRQNVAESDETAPIKDRGPVENLKFDYVVNNDALIINVLEPKASIDKTTITFQVKSARDLNGNKLLSPITWTAYIDRNQLKWSDKEINLVKDVNKPLSFSSYLVNSGGNSQQYVVYHLPSWLSASPSSGSIDPTGSQKISFTVNPALNIGSYEEIIYMRNDNNEIEALKVKLVVKGQKPDWVVKASDYNYNMVVYGKLRLNSVFSTNKEDMLGAFINGKCVGVANNTFNASNSLWYTFLTVYSNLDVKNQYVEFRIWQASTGKTYTATPSQGVSFVNDAINGTASAPIIFDGSNLVFQDLVLNQNWNWISFNMAIPTGMGLDTLLRNGTWTPDDVIKNDGTPFKGEKADAYGVATYTTNNGWKGTLNTANNTALFKMKVANAQLLTVGGSLVNLKTTAIPVKGAQWSYISYLPQVNATLKEALAGYRAGDGDVIKSQTGFSMYSAQGGWIGSLTYLEPGKGYMLYRKAADSVLFYYPTISGSLGGRVMGTARANPNLYENPVPANFTNADNMTIVATVAPDFAFQSGDSVLAFVNGELRGKVKPVFNPETGGTAFFFTIGGDREQPVVFTVQRNGNLIAQSTTVLPYQSNTHLGTLSKPVALRFVQDGSQVTVYPNPFRNNTTLAVDLRGLPSQEHRVQVSILDVTGRTVQQLPAKTVTGTGFTTVWNGRNSAGALTANGVYFVRVTVDGKIYVQRVLKQ